MCVNFTVRCLDLFKCLQAYPECSHGSYAICEEYSGVGFTHKCGVSKQKSLICGGSASF